MDRFDKVWVEGCALALYESGCMDRFDAVMASGLGPQFPWLTELERDAQLGREDVEAGLDEDARLNWLHWMMQEEHLQPLRLCQAFLRGVWYEREHPGRWKF